MEDKRSAESSGMDIKEALGKIQVDYVAANVSEKSTGNGSLEFEFTSEASSGGLIFEDESEVKPAEDIKQEEKSEDPAEGKITDEFSLPESFEVNEKYDTPSTENEKTKIWTTYVPRFTDASENYRMVGDTRPRPEPSEAPVDPVSNEEEGIDPTAEFEGDDISKIVEIVGNKEVDIEGFSDKLNVFKFPERKAAGAEEIPEVTKHDDSSFENDVEEASPVDAEPEETDIIEELEQIVEEKPTEPTPVKAQGPIEIPDPTLDGVHLIDYNKEEEKSTSLAKYEAAPVGAVLAADGKKESSGEYTAFYQRDNFKDRFLDSLLSVKIRFVAVIVLALALLLFENLGFVGIDVIERLRLIADPWAISVIDMQLSICVFLLALPEFVESVKQLFKKILTPEFLILPSLLVVVACNAVNIAVNDRSPISVGFIYAIHVVFAIHASSLRRIADFSAFKATSMNGEKKILDLTPTRTLSQENLALDGVVDSYKSTLVRLFRTSFISDFFKRTSTRTENTFNNVISLAVAFGVSLVTGAVCFFVFDGIEDAALAFGTVYLLTVPALSILSHKLPYYHVQRHVTSESTVIIGESSLYEFEDADVITFDDTEIFGTEDVVLKRFMLYGDRENMTKAMRQMSSLFAVVGGPLDYIFANALDKRSAPATGAVIEDDGISGYVDGKRVLAGTIDYMIRHGITVHADKSNTENGADTTKVMYAADGNTVYAKFYIRYSFSEEFSALLPELREKNIVPLIYTRDPNISNDLLRTLTMGNTKMRVMKRFDLPETEEKNYLRISAGVVTFGDKMNAIRTILVAKKYSELQSKISKLELCCMAVGSATAVVCSLVRLPIPSLLGAVWQALFCGALYLVVKNLLAHGKKIKENSNDQNVNE